MQIETAYIYLQTDPVHIDLLAKIIEAYEHLGVVTTVDRHQGLVVVRGTEHTRPDLLQILANLPFPVIGVRSEQ